ncbi:MAG: ParB N-terminal domain-containing protein [Janthinobacterium lividum]
MQNSSAFQYLTVDTIHESSTNPHRTFEEAKLHELAESIRQHGLIQPITVRPNSDGLEIVAGARRFRAAQLAELFAVPARIVQIDDAQALGCSWSRTRQQQMPRSDIRRTGTGLQRGPA